MRRRDRRKFFEESAMLNDATYMYHYNRLMEIAIAVFEWKNVPETIDIRFLELTLFLQGKCVFFYDEELGYLALPCAISGGFNVYRIPLDRRAYAVNGYNRQLTIDDSVIIWNNGTRTNTDEMVRMFARRLYNLDRIVDVNANLQKSAGIIQGTEQQRLSLLNLYKEYDGNSPIIFGDKDLDINALSYISTGAPYVADKIHELRSDIYSEALTALGINNVEEKRERMLKHETLLSTGATIANRFTRLNARRIACEEINRMFGLNMSVDFREEFLDFLEEDEAGTKDTQYGDSDYE